MNAAEHGRLLNAQERAVFARRLERDGIAGVLDLARIYGQRRKSLPAALADAIERATGTTLSQRLERRACELLASQGKQGQSEPKGRGTLNPLTTRRATFEATLRDVCEAVSRGSLSPDVATRCAVERHEADTFAALAEGYSAGYAAGSGGREPTPC